MKLPFLAITSLAWLAPPILHAAPAPQKDQDATITRRELVASHRWLNLPMARDPQVTKDARLLVDGEVVRTFKVDLPETAGDWYAPLDIAPWKGRKIAIEVTGLPAGSKALDAIDQTPQWRGSESLYKESLRPQFRFSPQRGQIGDPNGLVYYQGKYHLFFQHSPFSWSRGLRHWGHAISTDLVHWEEIGDALFPRGKVEIFSGSAVVDSKNTAAFGPKGTSPLVLVYTKTSKPSYGICLAWSLDGRTFTPYEGNPVVTGLASSNRDPRVFWHEPTKRWVMAVYAGIPDSRKQPNGKPSERFSVRILTSPDLRKWTPASVVEGGWGDNRFLYECPDLYPLKVDGAADKIKWVLYAANGEYALGDFDGTTFKAETSKLASAAGALYAAQTFNNTPDGRRIQIGWVRAFAPGMPFNLCTSPALELTLRTTPAGPRLFSWPVKELDQLHLNPQRMGRSSFGPGTNPLSGIHADLFDLSMAIDAGSAKTITFTLGTTEILYDVPTRQIRCGRAKANLPLVNGRLCLRILSDRIVCDVFGANGLLYMPILMQSKSDDPHTLSLTCTDGTAVLEEFTLHEMASAWNVAN